MYSAELYSLAAALCWSCGGLLATNPVRALGAVSFNRIRMYMVFVMLSVMAFMTGGWFNLPCDSCPILAASALVGIFLGDSSFYGALTRLGPRRAAILFATNAPMSAILGFFLLDERLSANAMAGIVLVTAGVFLAVFHGTTANHRSSFEQLRGNMAPGVALGLFSAFCQAISLILVRPVLASGVDAIAASAVRVGVAAVILTAVRVFRSPMVHPASPLTLSLASQVAVSGLLGMALGATFILHALAYGPVGIVSTLSATSPVLVLPVLWIVTRECPAPGAWLGAFFAVAGAGCIFNA
jgi:drug/metabolite transporter (DMT)-like permease